MSHPSSVAGHGIDDVVHHYADIIAACERSRSSIGHSFGGLIASACWARFSPPLRSRSTRRRSRACSASARRRSASRRSRCGTPANRNRAVSLTPEQFRYGFGNALSTRSRTSCTSAGRSRRPGQPLFEAAMANSPGLAGQGRHEDADRGPLLLTAGGKDHTVPAASPGRRYKLYRKSSAVTELKEFPTAGTRSASTMAGRKSRSTRSTGSSARATDRPSAQHSRIPPPKGGAQPASLGVDATGWSCRSHRPNCANCVPIAAQPTLRPRRNRAAVTSGGRRCLGRRADMRGLGHSGPLAPLATRSSSPRTARPDFSPRRRLDLAEPCEPLQRLVLDLADALAGETEAGGRSLRASSARRRRGRTAAPDPDVPARPAPPGRSGALPSGARPRPAPRAAGPRRPRSRRRSRPPPRRPAGRGWSRRARRP